MANSEIRPAVWFPAIRCGSGADVFTERLVAGLQAHGICAEITWLPHRAEYAPWAVRVPRAPDWANLAHINTWLPGRFIPETMPVLGTIHSSVHNPVLDSYKSYLKRFYHQYWIKPIEIEASQRSARLVAVSEFAKREYQNHVVPTHVDVIHNGIFLSGDFQPNPTKKSSNDPFRLLYVGKWSFLKGVDLLAPVMEELGDRFELYYTADRGEIQSRLPANCHLIGRLKPEELAQYYRESDALLMPSRLEGLTLVALEAMACGLPVIAVDCASMAEVVHDGVTGFLCKKHDPDEFVAKCIQLASDPLRLLEMGLAGRARIESVFDHKLMVDRYISAYVEILTRQDSSRGISHRQVAQGIGKP